MLDQIIRTALQHHQAGRHQEAEKIYRDILERQPDHADVLYLLGLSLSEQRRYEESLVPYQRSIHLNSENPEVQYSYGISLKQLGRLDEAIAAYRHSIRLKPDKADAHSNLGNALTAQRRFDEAIAEYGEALRLNSNNHEVVNNLGIAYATGGNFAAAIQTFEQAIRMKPDYPDALNNLANVLRAQRRNDEAIAAYRRAIELRPGFAEMHNNLGTVLAESGKMEEAFDAYREALRLKPNYPDVYVNVASAMNAVGRYDEAIVACQQALHLKPTSFEALLLMGNALTEKMQFAEAIAAYRKVLALRPDLPEAHWNLAHVLLLTGDFQSGQVEYEWRQKLFAPAQRNFTQPRWRGEDLKRKTLLLHAEQGLGDAIQFVRYASLAAERGARVVVECPPELLRLFQRIPKVECIAAGSPLPAYDFHCPLLSLPMAFGTKVDTIPAPVPYLNPDPALNDKWARNLGSAMSRVKVGLCWAGRSSHMKDSKRSIPLSAFAPLTDAMDVTFYSLQKGEAASQTPNPPVGMTLMDFTPGLSDFAETAAFIAQLDLVITVDTAVAHVAGAMGKPVWLLLAAVPDWRWLLEREDTPWYPTMRLFRQRTPGDWAEVIDRMAGALISM